MWERLFGLDFRRRRLLARAAPGPMRDYLAAPFPARGDDYLEAPFLALDLETTGLDPRTDEILSIGMVALRGGTIDLASARHFLVAPTRAVPENSATIHHITDDRAAQGRPIAEVMPEVLAALAGRVLLGHHVRTERGFLGAACRRLYGQGLLVPLADTEMLLRRQLERRGEPITSGSLRLAALRERFGLPRYKAHDALVDALATAELFCAFAAHRELRGPAPLRLFLEAP